MKTLIIPCAGKSSRFRNTKPKYLLTYPDGKLMVEKSLEGIRIEDFDRIIITIVREHCERYFADLILKQAFEKEKKVEILILNEFTSCQSETVAQTIIECKVSGEFWVKDSDNYVKAEIAKPNVIVGLNIERFKNDINRLSAKSFLLVNEQGNIVDIIEKKIKSQIICIGVYGFKNERLFLDSYEEMKQNRLLDGEIYISHVISNIIGSKRAVFKYQEAEDYEDWGTSDEWNLVKNMKSTYFINFDGVLIHHCSRYGEKNWGSEYEPILDNLLETRRLLSKGAQIIVTTTRKWDEQNRIYEFLKEFGIICHSVICECHSAPQYIINDFSDSNPYPSCSAISIPRNEGLKKYV